MTTDLTPRAIIDRLQRTWSDAPGVPGFLNSVDHKRVGHRYLVTAFAFLLLGGLQALVMRAQLAAPGADVVSAEVYNRLFTMHGTTMIFLFNTPIIAGFGNYLVPLQIGTRDMAFPRLNMLSYWIFLLSGLFLYGSFLIGQVPDTGWFAYVPLSGAEYSPGIALDFWTLGVVFVGISTTAGAVNFIVTIFKLRAPGMAISRLPVATWGFLVTSFVIVFALPAISLGALLMYFDRALGMNFFDPAAGGSPVLYQHLFWFWGHPEVYILFIPATGMISTIIPTFARRELAGYTWAVAALVATGFVSFGVWVHHMFAVGLPTLTTGFFSAAGLVITFPTAVQIFAWLSTLSTGGPLRFRTPLLFSLGFIVTFVLGGITGVMVSALPFDWQATDSYFIVAHLHYVLIGGVVFPIFAALYYWLPKMTGWMLHERLGQTSFWLMFIGFHVAFFPMHIVGLLGMPRRIYTFHEGLGWGVYNLISTVGAFVFALGVLVSLANFFVSRARPHPAGANPWEAGTLEWATDSPPGVFNFATMPVVTGRYPLWRARHEEGQEADPGGVVLAPEDEEEQTLGTAGLDARFEEVLDMPGPSYWPGALAVGLLVLFVGLLARSMIMGLVGTGLVVVSLCGWHWAETIPSREEDS